MSAGAVTVDLDRPRELRFDHNAIADLDMALYREAGVTLFQVFERVDDNNQPAILMGLGGARLLLWAGLKWSDRKITIERAGQILNNCGKPLAEIIVPILEALVAGQLFKQETEATDAGEAEAPATASPSEAGANT